MTTPTTCEPTEELRARARQAYQQWQQGDIIARSGLPSSILDFIAQHAAQESSRANERAEGLAKELEALRAPRMFPLQFQMRSEKYDKQQFREVPWPIAERAYSTYAARYGKDQSLERLAQRGGFDQREMDEFYPAWRDELSFPAQLAAATARVAEMQDRMVAAFGEGTTADQLVAISHEHEARAAELEKQLADKLEAVTVSARVEKAESRADKAEAELAKLREQVGAVGGAPLGDRELLLKALCEDKAHVGRKHMSVRFAPRAPWDLIREVSRDSEGFPTLTPELRDALTKAVQP